MAINALSDALLRKREELFIEGFFVESADDATPGVDSTDETIHLLGKPSALVGVTVDNGTLSVTILRENAAGQNLPQVITDNDPLVSDATGKLLNWGNVVASNLWINVTNNARTQYLGGTFYPSWIPSIGGAAGAPNDRGRRTFTGKCQIPVEITGVGLSIQSAMVMSGNQHIVPGDATSGNSIFWNSGTGLYAVPGKTNVYALHLTLINSGSSGWTKQEIGLDDITASMVLATGRVDWAAITASQAVTIVPNYAHIKFITSGVGIYPSSGHSPHRLSRTGQNYLGTR